MVLLKPHTITITPVAQAQLGDGVIQNPAPGTQSGAISCLCVPMTPRESYQAFGAVLLNPWTVYLEVSDAQASASPNAEILFNGQQYWQKGEAEIRQTGDVTDCAVIYMSQNQFGFP